MVNAAVIQPAEEILILGASRSSAGDRSLGGFGPRPSLSIW